jgi:hypothetical protein
MSSEKNKPDPRADLRRIAKWAAIVGAVLAVVCPYLPEHYQAPCAAARAIVNVCTAGGSP